MKSQLIGLGCGLFFCIFFHYLYVRFNLDPFWTGWFGALFTIVVAELLDNIEVKVEVKNDAG